MTRGILLSLCLVGASACAGQQPDVHDVTDAMLDLRAIIVMVCTQPPMIDQATCDRGQAAWNKISQGSP